MSPTACIVTISSRNQCLKHCLESVWKHYNKAYNYPVYVHYFDDIYDDSHTQTEVVGDTGQSVTFKSVPYQTPSFIKEGELYYNRTNLWYVKNRFSIARKGYLHMCHFTSNMYGYPNTDLHNYDYIMTHDDDAGFLKELPYNPVEVMESRPEMMGAFSFRQTLKNGAPHQGHRDTRVKLWEFTKAYVQHHNIVPADSALRDLIDDPEAPEKYHYLEWPDTYVIKSEMFETESWKKWISTVNKFGGNYKYRWGDCVLFGLYHRIYHGRPYGFEEEGNPITEGYYDQGQFRHIQDYAPSIQDTRR